MILNTIKSIQKFSSTSRKYKDLEAVASHCIDKLKFFIGYVQLQNEKEPPDLAIEFDSTLDLKEYLDGSITNELKSVIYYVDKKKIKDLSADEYEKHISLLYPFILGPIFKACKQHTNPKLTIISLEGIHKLLSFESLAGTLIEESRLYGCEDIAESRAPVNGLEFLFTLLFDIYDSKIDDESILIQIIKASISLIARNVGCFSRQIFYSICLALINIYSNTIDNGIRAASYSILMHFVNMFFDDSFENRSEYFGKYFVLMLEVLYTLTMTDGMIYIKKHETQRGRLNQIRFVSPLSFEFRSEDFVEVEDNFFRFSQIKELDPRILKIRNLCLEIIHGIFAKVKLREEHQDSSVKDILQEFYRLHFLSVIRNTVLNDSQTRKNAICLWRNAIPIYDLSLTIRLHGVFISKCIRGLFESGIIEASEKAAIVGSVFGTFTENIHFLTFLFVEFDLNANSENLVLNTINFLVNQIMEGGPIKNQQKNLHSDIFSLITDLLVNLLEELQRTQNADSLSDVGVDDSILLIRKHLIGEYVQDFNQGNYERSISLLSEIGVIDKEDDHLSIARFLVQNKAVSKKAIGDYISLPDQRNRQILNQYCNQFSFKSQSLDFSLYLFLSNFHLPGEAQKIDRIMEEFSLRYFLDNPELFQNKDKIYITAFSLIMLHTDAHSREIKDYYRMSKSDFIKNHNDLLLSSPKLVDFLEKFYDNVTLNEWIFEGSKEACKVSFPYLEYLVNFVNLLESSNTSLDVDCAAEPSSSSFQIKIISHEIIHKIVNLLNVGTGSRLLGDQDQTSHQDLIKFIDLVIKRKFDTIYFNGIYTEDLVYWKLIANAPIQWIIGLNECLRGRKLPVSSEMQQESTYFQYDGSGFRRSSKVVHSNNILQASSVMGTNQNLSKWMANYKTSDLKVREVNGVFQTSISDLIKEMVPNWSDRRQPRGAGKTAGERAPSVRGSHTVLLGRVICCYFTGMLSNVDFWLCFGKDTMANWMPILKYTTELGIMLGLEASFTITLTVLSYLTNVMALPLSFNDLFFCNSSMSEEIRTVLNNDISFENEKYSKALRFPELEERGVLEQFSDLVGRSFRSSLNNHLNDLDSRQENKVKDENERSVTHLPQVQSPSQGSDILLNYLISNEAFSTYSSLNYLNIEAIKTIFEICQHSGDKVPYVLWVIMIGIISQVDRYFYVKSILKGSSNTEIPDHYYSDHNKFLINKSKIYGNDLPKFLTLSRISINTTKSQATSSRHFSQIFNRKFVKSTKSIFNSTKSVVNSGLSSSSRDNSRSVSRASSSRETSPDFASKDEEVVSSCREGEGGGGKPSAGFQNVVVIHGQSLQYVQIYMNLRNSISLNNLWFKEEEIIEKAASSSSSVGSNDEMLWIDEDKYGLILSQVSLINLRRMEMINSKLITNELEFCQVMERIFTGITMDPSKNKKVITDLFLALIFNARNQIVLSGRRSIELFLFRKVFEFMDLIVNCYFKDFPQVILWDKYFIPIFYAEIIQILDGKAYLEVLDLIKSFVTKYIRSQNSFIRSEYMRAENEEEDTASSNGGERSGVVGIVISSQSDSSSEERAFGESDSNFRSFPSTSLNLTQFSIFTLFKKLLWVSLDNQPYGDFVATVELSLEILNSIQNLYQDLRLFNFLDLCEILEIYQHFIIGVQKCSERSQERNTGSYSSKKKKLINLLSSTSHSSKEDSLKNKENEVLSRVSFCLMGMSKISFLFDDGIFAKLMNTLFIMLKLFAPKMESRQVCRVLDYILYMFYHKIKYVHTRDLDDDNMYNRLSTFKSQRPASNNGARLSNHGSNPNQYRLLLKCLRDFSQLVTSILVFERKLLNLYYHYLVNISKILNYWLWVCPSEQAVQEISLVPNITSDVVGLISLNKGAVPSMSIVSESGKRKGVKFLDKLVSEEEAWGGTKGGGAPLEEDSGTEEYYEDYDLEIEEEDDDEDNCLVNDEADLGIIRCISYSSSRNEKRTFEVTNKSSHLDNTQLTLSNLEDIKVKAAAAKTNLAVLNRKIKEINRAFADKTEDENDFISDELLESACFDDIKNIKSERDGGDSKIIRIIHNVYKIIEFYIFKTNVTYYRFLFKDWLILSNQVLLSQVMNMFCKDDIRIQYRMVVIYLNFLFSNKDLFGYREWHQVFQYYSSFLIDLTRSTQIDPSKYIIEDVRSRYSIDDFNVAYGDRGFGDQVEKRMSKDDGAVDSRKGRQRTQFEMFFRSKIFSKKYLGLVESKKSHNQDHGGADSSKVKRLKSKGKRILLKQCLEKNWKCYSHRYIKNTGDQDMYDSYAGLRVAIEELVLEDLGGSRSRSEQARMAALSRPDCINDLYTVLLVIYNMMFDWYVVDLRSSERRGGELDVEVNRTIYETLMSSVSRLYTELVNGLSLLKFDLFQYNIYLSLWTQLRIRKDFSLLFKDSSSSQHYKNELLAQCEDILGMYVQMEKGRSEAPERKEKGGLLHSDDYSDKRRLSSIISSNIHFNHHFNSSYDRILKNKIDISCTYRAVLNGLLKDLKEMKESDYIMKSSRLYKMLLDITLLEDQHLRILSRDILIEFAKRNEPPRSSSCPSSPASSSLSSEEKIVPLLDELSS